MDRNLKKIKYQELFLAELRNNYLGEKRLKEALQEMETKENMRKLSMALQKIWKQTDKDINSLENAFIHSKGPEPLTEQVEGAFADFKGMTGEDVKEPRESTTGSHNLLTYDNLVQLVDNLNTEQITEILKSAPDTGSNHHYLTRLAEKLTRERDSRA